MYRANPSSLTKLPLLKALNSIALCLLAGCSQYQVTGQQLMDVYRQHQDQFGPRPALPSVASLTALTPEQVSRFQQFFYSKGQAQYSQDERLYHYLKSRLSGFSYRSDTFSAARSLAEQQGNCLSLALVTSALAQAVNLQLGYQLVDVIPVFDRPNTLVVVGQHVRTKVFTPVEQTSLPSFARAGVIIDYFPGDQRYFLGNVSGETFAAMYYNNIAVDLLNGGDLPGAYWYARRALELAPRYAPHINTLAVIFRRAGNTQQAEAIYELALTQTSERLTLLKNYRSMLMAEGRVSEAQALSRQIAEFDDPSPFVWLSMAEQSYREGDYRQAIRMYHRSEQLAPYLDEIYMGLAKSWYRLGKPEKTRAMLEKAQAASADTPNEKRYRAKLQSLGG